VTLPDGVFLPIHGTQQAADLTRETEHRRRAEDALQENEREYLSVIEVLSEGIAVIQADGSISSLNESGARMVGAARPELIGRLLLDLRWHAIREDGSSLPHSEHPALVTLQTGKAIQNFVMGLHQRDHSIRWLSVNTYPLSKRPGEPPYAAAASFTDITEHVRHEREMRESYDALDRLTHEFIGIVSHELRTPLTAIRGALSLLESDAFATLPPKAHTLLNIARTNTERLMRIINNILDLDQLESGQMVLNVVEVDPALLMQDVVASIAEAAEGKHITIVTEIALPPVLKTDRERLMHVLKHLLSNAVKFSPMSAEVRLRASTPSPECVLFEVIDHGIGIPDTLLDRMFKSFAQANMSDTRAPGSAGLGLAIARSTVERLGGRIGVESEQHVRTRFWFELPWAAHPAGTAHPQTDS
jgi:PAS domain S-box-containing protein